VAGEAENCGSSNIPNAEEINNPKGKKEMLIVVLI